VATISRLLKVIGLLRRISSILQVSFAKETYNFMEPTSRSHPTGGTRVFCAYSLVLGRGRVGRGGGEFMFCTIMKKVGKRRGVGEGAWSVRSCCYHQECEYEFCSSERECT